MLVYKVYASFLVSKNEHNFNDTFLLDHSRCTLIDWKIKIFNALLLQCNLCNIIHIL